MSRFNFLPKPAGGDGASLRPTKRRNRYEFAASRLFGLGWGPGAQYAEVRVILWSRKSADHFRGRYPDLWVQFIGPLMLGVNVRSVARDDPAWASEIRELERERVGRSRR